MTAVILPGAGAATELSPAGTPSAGRRIGVRSVTERAYRWLARVLMVVAVLAFAGLAVGPHVLGYRTMTMLTGSMAPEINPGDVTVATSLPVDRITAGMIVSYHIPVDDHHVVSHRVVSVERGPDGRVTIQTKGDANDAVDPWKATLQGDTVYQVRAVIPHLGLVIEAFRKPVVTKALVYGAPTLLAGWLLVSIWRPAVPASRPQRPTEDVS
jgi:signal peptidase I